MCSKPGGGLSQYKDGLRFLLPFLELLSRERDLERERLRSRDLDLKRIERELLIENWCTIEGNFYDFILGYI